MHKTKKFPLKEEFSQRMEELLGKDEFERYLKSIESQPYRSIRINTLKISVDDMLKRFKKKGWKVRQPFKNYPEILIVESELEPGELGKSVEHLLGYYYVQDLASMLPPLVLNPLPGERVLDLCSAPGSKTTQMAAMMENTGSIIANEVSIGRLKILASNLERCGVINVIITKKDGAAFCKRVAKTDIRFDKILLDAPCSGEGTLRSNPKTAIMWNPKNIKNLSRLQKGMLSSAFEILKLGGEILYSTCTHAPEENEEVLDYVLRKFEGKIAIEKISLPLPSREGILKWRDKEYLEEVRYSCRVYPHDSGNTEGFFLAKLKKVGE